MNGPSNLPNHPGHQPFNAAAPKDEKTLNEGLLRFLQSSPTPFHAATSLASRLGEAGYRELQESDSWALTPGERYFVRRNGSAVIAFQLGRAEIASAGFRMVGAHTDSPTLRIKPNPEVESCSYLKLGVEIYGGALLSTWFDRDLSLAGRIGYLTKGGLVASALVDFGRAVAVIPNLAIHLNREVNENRSINKQTELPPILLQVTPEVGEGERSFKGILLEELKRRDLDAAKVLEYELSMYDVQPPALIGLRGDFITSARLDNLFSCYIGLNALLEAGSDATCLLVANDHEEVGSASTSGASGPFLRSVLERIAGTAETLSRAIDRSVFISTDNAHGIHPNYPEKHDNRHGPLLNHGPVLKLNANQRYATNSETGSLFAWICERAGVPYQRFVSRSDMACGSTIGPLTATVLGVKTVDVGMPTFAMHSVRETAGAHDGHFLYRALRQFFNEPHLP